MTDTIDDNTTGDALTRRMRDALIRGAFRSHSRAGGTCDTTCDAAYDWHLDPEGMAAIIHKDTHLENYL